MLAAKGKKIFEEGLPDQNVPACAACHGLDAHGYEANPRLAGQLASYIQTVLATWDKQRGHDLDQESYPSSVMAPVARSLTKPQAAAVAAYLSSLK
jgi:cytochrome c553